MEMDYKTTTEHFQSLPDGYKEIAMECLSKHPKFPDSDNIIHAFAHEAIGMIKFDETEQGIDWWYGLYAHLRFGTPIPEFINKKQ